MSARCIASGFGVFAVVGMACSSDNPAYNPTAALMSTGAVEAAESTSGALSATGVGVGANDAADETGPRPMSDTSTGAGEGAQSSDGTTGAAPDLPNPKAVLFINFDGAQVVNGPDDATIDQTALADVLPSPQLTAFDGVASRRDVLQRLDEIWMPFHVEVSDVRPDDGDYAMVIVTASPPPLRFQVSLAIQDCGDTNPTSVGVVFDPDGDLSADALAVAISHAAGRGVGLENTIGGGVMGETLMEGSAFVDGCLPLAPLRPACGHPECGAGEQNSHAHLASLYPGD
ncbi:MAG: hypothetical protein AAF721_38500 [Myxococcota bacterium]